MATEQRLQTASYEAGSDLSGKQFYFVNLNSSSQLVLAGDGERAIGVLQDKPAAQGRAGAVAIGGQTKVEFGATVAAGAAVASDSAGKAVTAATGDATLGTCVEGGASGEIGSMIFQPGSSGV